MSNHMTPVHSFLSLCCFHILRGMSYPVSMTVPTVLINCHAREVNNEELETSYEKAASVE